MIAAAGGALSAIKAEFLRGQLVGFSLGENGLVDLFQFVPVGRWREVDFDDSGIRRHAECFQAGIGRRRIAFQPDRPFEMGASVFHRGDQIKIIGKLRCVRKEDV